MTPQEYVDHVGQRMAADGCEVGPDKVGRMPALVGVRKDFIPLALSRMHLVTAVARFDGVDEAAVQGFTSDVSSYSKQRTQALRGLQSGIGAFAVCVTDLVASDAVPAAMAKPRMDFAVRIQPVLVNIRTRTVHTFNGSMLWGWAFNGHLRRKLRTYVVPPG